MLFKVTLIVRAPNGTLHQGEPRTMPVNWLLDLVVWSEKLLV